jgi:hypothetical protein
VRREVLEVQIESSKAVKAELIEEPLEQVNAFKYCGQQQISAS